MSHHPREVRCGTGPPAHPVPTHPVPNRAGYVGSGSVHRRGPWPVLRSSEGSLSLEAVMILPILAILVVVLLQLAALVTDVLLLHEAARSGARAAATTSGTRPVAAAVTDAAPELPDIKVQVTPTVRGDGDLVRVEVRVTRSIGPVDHRLRAVAHARVEPAVGTTRRDVVP